MTSKDENFNEFQSKRISKVKTNNLQQTNLKTTDSKTAFFYLCCTSNSVDLHTDCCFLDFINTSYELYWKLIGVWSTVSDSKFLNKFLCNQKNTRNGFFSSMISDVENDGNWILFLSDHEFHYTLHIHKIFIQSWNLLLYSLRFIK